MGGIGSGPYSWKTEKVAKGRVESTLSLDINELKKDLTEGNSFGRAWTWQRSILHPRERSEMAIYVRKDEIYLSYSISEKKYYYPVGITWTSCHYGGKRPWFFCPGCSQRAGKLYLKKGLFKCRKCQNLTYLRCQVAGNEVSEITHKMYKLADKLKLKDFKVYKWPDILQKPKGMHEVTFMRLELQLLHLFEKRMEALGLIYKRELPIIDRLIRDFKNSN